MRETQFFTVNSKIQKILTLYKTSGFSYTELQGYHESAIPNNDYSLAHQCFLIMFKQFIHFWVYKRAIIHCEISKSDNHEITGKY